MKSLEKGSTAYASASAAKTQPRHFTFGILCLFSGTLRQRIKPNTSILQGEMWWFSEKELAAQRQ